jgi:hypothetical protein
MKRRRAEPRESYRVGVDAGWMADGSFSAHTMSFHRKTTEAVLAFCRRRRDTEASPADLAALVRVTQLERAFPSVGQWERLHRFADWSFAQDRTSAEAAVKRSSDFGRGSRPATAIEVDNAKRAIDDLLTPGEDAPPPVGLDP